MDRKAVQYVHLLLPPPISANAIWRSFNRGGRVTAIKSKAYREWIEKAGEMIQSQNPGKIEGGYGLSIKVPKKCRIDLDNVPKAINDLAQAHGIIGNDRQCQKLTVERGSGVDTEVMFISTTMGEV